MADTRRLLTGNSHSLAFVTITGKMKTMDNVYIIQKLCRSSFSSYGGLIELSRLPIPPNATMHISLDRGNSGNCPSRPGFRLLRGVLIAMQGQLSYLRIINQWLASKVTPVPRFSTTWACFFPYSLSQEYYPFYNWIYIEIIMQKPDRVPKGLRVFQG